MGKHGGFLHNPHLLMIKMQKENLPILWEIGIPTPFQTQENQSFKGMKCISMGFSNEFLADRWVRKKIEIPFVHTMQGEEAHEIPQVEGLLLLPSVP